jgi:hypothetical protein
MLSGALLSFALGNLKHDLGALWAWLCHRSFWQLTTMALAVLLVIQHFQLSDARHDRDSYKSQRDYYKAAIDEADKAVRKAQAAIDQISKELRERTDEENRRIAGDADALRLSGPGKAACRPAPQASGGHGASPAKPDAPGPALPPDDRAAVPWGWLTDRAQEHDQLLTENKAWRDWYQRLVENWPK